jgi:fibronectin-binding autotransporter adhesin
LNQGLVNANVPGGTLNFWAAGATNVGVMEATNGGTLELGSVNNTGGTILASGGTVTIEGTVTGGTLTATAQSSLVISGYPSILGGVTLSPSTSATVEQGSLVYITGGLVNNGTITLTCVPGWVDTALYFENSQTLSGSGSIVLAPYPSQALLEISGTLTQAAGHTISGAGEIEYGYFVNQGSVNANVPGETLGGYQVSGVTNSGIMEATSGGSLLANYPFSNTGTVLASGGTVNITGAVAQLSGSTLTGGTWIAQGGSPLLITAAGSNITTNQANVILDGAGSTFSNINSLKNNQGSFSLLDGQNFSTTGSLTNSGTIDVDAASSLTVNGSYSTLPGSVTIADGKLAYSGTMNVVGSLGGSGTVGGAVSIATGGILAPGDAPGTLTIAGNLSMANSAVCDWEIGAGAADLTHVTGNLNFGADEILDISLFGTSLPPPGDYTLFTVDGTFSGTPTWTVELPNQWTHGPIVQSGDQIILTDLQPLPEPSTFVLLGACAVGALGRRCWRRSKRTTPAGSR